MADCRAASIKKNHALRGTGRDECRTIFGWTTEGFYHVHAAANFVNKTNTEEVINLIRESGFVPAQRTTLYQILKVHESAAAA